MIALLIGIILILFAVYAVLPVSWSINWWSEVIEFLKGGVPIMAVFIGLISFFVGVADIKDKIEAKREEREEQEKEKQEGSEVGSEKPETKAEEVAGSGEKSDDT